MALRLKRGTNAERLNYTPELGELIYVTDYSAENVSPLWIGNGSTVGGNEITGNGDTEVVSDTTPQLGGNLDINGFDIVGNGDIDTNGNVDITGNLLAGSITASSISGNFDGDLTGSVFGDDSTKIIDGINGTIRTTSITSDTNLFLIDNNGSPENNELIVNSLDGSGIVNLRQTTDADLLNDTETIYGRILFSRNDVNGVLTTGAIFGRENSIYIGQTSNGDFTIADNYVVWKDQKLGIKITDPTVELDVVGSAKISNGLTADLTGSVFSDDSTTIIDSVNGTITSPGFVQFGSYTDAERNVISAVNGMVIYNSTVDKFQGYQGGEWINLDDGSVV